MDSILEVRSVSLGVEEGYKTWYYILNYIKCIRDLDNATLLSHLWAVEMSYTISALSVSGWDEKNNKSMYERFGMSITAKAVDCEVVEWVK